MARGQKSWRQQKRVKESQERWLEKVAQRQRDYELSRPPPDLEAFDPTPVRAYKIVQTSRWQELPACESEDFQTRGNSHCETQQYSNETGAPSLRQQSATCLARHAHSLTPGLLKEVPNATVWKSAWDAILYGQHDSLNVFLMFARELQKHSDFLCHYNGLLHPSRALTDRCAVLRALLLRGKRRHRIESVAQTLTVGDISYLELGIKDIRNELVLNYTRDDLFEHAQNALTRLKSLTVLDMRYVDISDATLSLWRNALIRGDWPQLKVVLLGPANADKIASLMDIPQLWYVGYRGDRLAHRNWYTCVQGPTTSTVPERLQKTIRCAQSHPSSWLLSSLKELNNETQRGKLVLEINFSMTSWDLEELRKRPMDYVHCVRMRNGEERASRPPPAAVKTEPKPLYRQVARKRGMDAAVSGFFGQAGPKRPCS
ncbi:hypothetical protein CJU90_3487 [Yarrowia sp. C11]|nr:hypothetical protein CKK34_4933 [Yarrowia sp. E02]KAG5369947.1 hypothetical protein CJU90_3487 [Yarrowia sp. C11]